MLTRALVIGLWSAYALASLAPLAVVNDNDNDCALYLSGPGRTSAFDYSLNLLRGNFGYEGQHTCITYEAINQAYVDARKRILVSQPKGDWKPEDYASVGELILDISISLARTYGLTYEEIEKGLPLIDTSRTLIREVCPPVFSHVECRAGKYRRFDGLCNNLENPTWGATMAPFQRLIGPLFADGINAPRIAHTGRDLPLSRVVSRTMHPDDGFHDHAGTVMVIAWGQFMDHDYTLTGTPLDPINRNDPEECCKRPPHLKHPYCNEIRVPDDDYFYRLFGVKCIDFVRGFPSPRPGCRLGSRVPFNTLTGVIDGNTVYGVTEKFARKLRTGYGGLLRMNSVFKEYGLKDLLPLKLDIPDEGCTRPNKNMYCFEAGEIRVNEQLVLTVMHTLMAREHNRVAQALAEVNPHWDDETLFQEARRINVAEIQHITYNEFLPILLGKDVMEKFGLVLEKEGFWDGYDHNVNTDVIDAFASAAYRFGHSLLPTAVERWSKAHKFIASKRLSDLIRRPYDLYRAGVLDEYVMGLMNQVAQAMDDSITQEVTNHLFKKVGARFGMDLVSFNMQRGREFGIPGYMEFRKFCGLPGANSFQDLFGSMPNETVRKYESIFEHPIDVDLWSGGVSERPLPGSMLGPTFACIIATQFSYSRRGDRFWFELPNQPSSFTPKQLTEIRKSRLARVICDNTDIIDTVQLYPMVLPDHELNPRVPCRSGIIPSMDFSKWAEPVPFQGAAKQFITDAVISSYNETNACEDTVTENISEATIINKNESIVSNKAEDEVKSNADYTVHVKETANSTETISIDNKNSNIAFDCENVTGILDQTNEETLKRNNSGYSDDSNNTNDCKNITATLDQLKKGHVETNKKLVDKGSLLTYLLKNDAENTIQKPNGHQKNSLKRKKRSDINHRYGEYPIKSQSKLLNNDYKISHHTKEREYPQQDRTGNIISSSNLADFNIETLHENGRRNKNIPEKFEKSFYSPPNFDYFRKGHEESNEKHLYKPSDSKNTNEHRETDKSEEKTKNSENIRAPHRPKDSQEISDEDYSTSKKKESSSSEYNSDSTESREKSKPFHKKDASYTDSQESNEKNDRSHYLSISNKPNDKNQERKGSGRETSSYEKKPSTNSRAGYGYQRDDTPYSREVKDDDENRSARKEIQHPRHDSNAKDPVAIQDVDLGDFSYERIKVNDKGQVELAGDPHENGDDSRLESNPITNTSKPQSSKATENTGRYTLPRESAEQPYNRDESDEVIKPVPLNDGEIKPVVELNSENESKEINKDNVGRQKENFSNEGKSIENLNKDGNSHESNEKIELKKNPAEKGDLKQQFERIPLNYDHTKEEQKQNSESLHDRKPSESTTESSSEQNHQNNDGVLPITPRYDENLNIKFDDISIKLPEIKLPDDILAYNFEEPTYEKDKEDQRQYNNDDSDNLRSKQKKKYDDDEDGDDDHHHSHDDREGNDENRGYGNYDQDDEEKQDYQNKKNADNEEEQDVDLYEKFVRERFGKQGSFGKRSENLQEDARKLPQNPKLYETLQNILKKTEETEKEAEKSGDPNAGYMWTLEYGENL